MADLDVGIVQAMPALFGKSPGRSPVGLPVRCPVGHPAPDQAGFIRLLALAGLIVDPSTIAIPNGGVTPQVVQAVVSSLARKLLLPTCLEGGEWIGVDRWEMESMVRQTVRSIKQVLAGEEVKPLRPLGAGAVIGIILIVLFVLIPLAIALVDFIN